MLQVVVFSILFAMALILVPEAKRRPMLSFAGSLSETMFKFTNLVMYAAPVGVFGAVAYTVGHLGLGVLLPLLKLLATMYLALVFFIVCVLDRKSTRLNSSHTVISYAVFCLKKKRYASAAGRVRVRDRCPVLA